MKHFQQLLLWTVISLAGCATNVSPLPPNDTLQANALEVGRAMGFSNAYEDRAEGLFVWSFKTRGVLIAQAGNGCDGLFAWYIKRVGNSIALDDPIAFMPGCSLTPKQLSIEGSQLQEEFKSRWSALVGPIIFVPPTAATHSTRLVSEVMARLIKEKAGHSAQE
jgi:hypothetical protein